jgi:hypothetical protein
MTLNIRLRIRSVWASCLNLWFRELRNQSREHLGRRLAQVKPELELFGVFMKMLAGNMNVSAADAAFKVLPKVLQIVDVRSSHAGIFARAVTNRLVIEASLFQTLVRLQFVGVNHRAVHDVLFNDRLQSFLCDVRDNFRHHLAVALQHAENNRLIRRTASANAVSFSADVGFINFNFAIQRHFVIHLRHVITNLMAHAPRRLIGYAKLTFQLLSRYAVTGNREHMNGNEPRLHGRAAVFEQSASGRVNVITTEATGEGARFAEAIPFRFLLALRAFIALTIAAIKNVLDARFVIGKLREKLFKCRAGFNLVALHVSKLTQIRPVRQGDNSLFC